MSMLTEGRAANRMADYWDLDWVSHSGMFATLTSAAKGLPKIGWPNVELLNEIADASGIRIVNARGQRIRFIEQVSKSRQFEDGFEPRAYLRGEVMVRPLNWHDLYNALVWMSFPTTKAVINARQYAALTSQSGNQRSATGDALTMFDEDGLVILSSDDELLDLVRDFHWKELFWVRRKFVQERARFLIFGHAMYEKARTPFVGMTGKALLFNVPEKTIRLQGRELNAAVDQLLATFALDPANFVHGQALAPLPVLGVPGWWSQNESEGFYDNTRYFRRGRKRNHSPASFSSS
jgi:hypothetical protein